MSYSKPELESVSKVIDRATIRRYAKVTDDFNPIHLDPEFAARTPMGGIIAHGMLSLNLIWQSLRKTYGPGAAEGACLDVRFIHPVREDDTVRAGGRAKPDAAGVYDVTVENQKGVIVISGTLTLNK